MPDRCNQIVLADDTFAVADQVFQEIEDLRLDGNQVAPAPQFAPVAIENIVGHLHHESALDLLPWAWRPR